VPHRSPADDHARAATIALAACAGVGPIAFHQLCLRHGSAQAALEATLSPAERSAALTAAAMQLTGAAARGIAITTPGDADYPVALRDLEDAPPVLHAMGDLALVDRASVAVVGSRAATPYGLRITARLAGTLARGGVTIVSGLAMGIDARAHEAALESGGATVAVLGTGVDVPYPRTNAPLHARITRRGLVLSESPQGRAAFRGAFPRRNRLIAALADVVLVVEAGVRSGALITATLAAEQGRLVAAVPGPVDVPSSEGSNALLRSGAHVVTSADDVHALLALTPRGLRALPAAASAGDRPMAEQHADLPPLGRRLLEVLALGARNADELVLALAVPPRDLAAALASLGISGLVEVDHAGLVHRT
jgi:DNA processing protein